MPVLPLKPYRGAVRKLVLGIYVSTTYSGVSYAILDPGEIPQIHGITHFPGQENAAGDSKIPSILYYRPDGTVHSVGAEAMEPGIELAVENEKLIFVEWFKLHLRPVRLGSHHVEQCAVPPLPRKKSAINVFADFLAYLFACARTYMCETHAGGEALWKSVALAHAVTPFVRPTQLQVSSFWFHLKSSLEPGYIIRPRMLDEKSAPQCCECHVPDGIITGFKALK